LASLKYRIFSKVVVYIPLKLWLILFYLVRIGRLPKLKRPKGFNEKLLHRKLYDRNTLYTEMADKLKSKFLVSSLCPKVAVPKVLWSGENVEDIDLDKLPNQFVFKANHASGTNLIVKNKRDLNVDILKKTTKSWFSHEQHQTMGEWAYKDIDKKVFVEEYLNFEGGSPDDYKFFVFDGVVRFIQFDQARFTNHKRNMLTRHWEDLDFNYSHPRSCHPKKPEVLEEMIEIAETLSMKLDFVRVDLYLYDGIIWFGEYTIYPGGGYEAFPSRREDLLFGEFWQ